MVSDGDLATLETTIDRDHSLCANARNALADVDDPVAEKYRDAATAQARGGELEVDQIATVSRSEDGGAYVMAWLWVSDEDAETASRALADTSDCFS